MSKTTKGLLIAAFSILAVSLIFSTLYTYSVSEELSLLRREGRSDLVYLRSRIRDLESEFFAQREDTDGSATTPMESEDVADDTTGDEGTASDGETTTAPTMEEGTEEVTIPTHSSPETSPSADTEPLPASPYLVAAYRGVIGVFDATGALLKTANVYIMTLPEADRAALEVGIPVGSWAEALRLLDMYE